LFVISMLAPFTVLFNNGRKAHLTRGCPRFCVNGG
jgi:hypothetical protein